MLKMKKDLKSTKYSILKYWRKKKKEQTNPKQVEKENNRVN